MSKKSAKRKAGIALREVIQAARKYVQAEHELERALKQEDVQPNTETTNKMSEQKGI